MTERRAKVLFLCTGNSARSQMAEAFLRHYAGDTYEAHSAGLDPQGINPYTVRIMTERGISLEGQTSDPVRKYLGKEYFGTVVTVCDHAEENCPRAWLQANNHLHWSFEDPAAAEGTDEEIMTKFRTIRDQIETQIRSWLVEQGHLLPA